MLRDLGRYYFALLMKLQSEANKSAPRWTNTYAEGMLKHHARELAYIRSMAGTREDLILTNYTYLRDAFKAKFTNLELQDTVIKESILRRGDVNDGTNNAPGTGEASKKKGCRCQNTKLHRLLSVKYYDAGPESCPVSASLNAQKARVAAKMLVTKIDDHDGTPSHNMWKGWAAKAVEAAQDGRTSF